MRIPIVLGLVLMRTRLRMLVPTFTSVVLTAVAGAGSDPTSDNFRECFFLCHDRPLLGFRPHPAQDPEFDLRTEHLPKPIGMTVRSAELFSDLLNRGVARRLAQEWSELDVRCHPSAESRVYSF